jgi:hypothetical protein
VDPYGNLAADIIIDAILIASGQSPASERVRNEEKLWLQSEQCRRWALVIGVDIETALRHPDSLVKLEKG